ncbi:MAG: AcrR family transcriptional regulator [Myxococcota bacterium]|jgi:AcrR family transcriptional regulator
MKTQRTFEDLSLRHRKRARTQLALVDALMDGLQTGWLADIKATGLAAAVGVSPATFFNYFKSKADLLTFFIQVWSIDMTVEARRIEADSDSPLTALEGVFAATADLTARNPRVMLEIIGHQAARSPDFEPPGVSDAVRLLRWPDVPDVCDLPASGLQDIVPRLLQGAVDADELPPTTDLPTLTLAVFSTFFGVPLLVAPRQPDAIAPSYQRQLHLLWAGARTGGA